MMNRGYMSRIQLESLIFWAEINQHRYLRREVDEILRDLEDKKEKVTKNINLKSAIASKLSMESLLTLSEQLLKYSMIKDALVYWFRFLDEIPVSMISNLAKSKKLQKKRHLYNFKI